jgi:uncharacterized protein YndB with AHSA1/START domain
MPADSVSATAIIDAPADVIFEILTDPAKHAAIDGTGWVLGQLNDERLAAAGQIFRMSMHHDEHPDGDYQTVNEVQTFDPPSAISWKPGYDTEDGGLGFGGWVWRYDLAPAGPGTTSVTLTYDWSAVPASIREYIPFPPFGPDHLDNSLAHLADLATS